MTDLSQKTALVFDHGNYLETAIALSKGFGKVLYHVPWEFGTSHLNDAMVGEGFDEIEVCPDPFDPDVLSKIDICVFPDVQHGGLQLLLESLGKRVWGSRKADRLELDREFLKEHQAKIGMDVPPHDVVVGMKELERYLIDHDGEELYIKVSKYRGSWETKKFTKLSLIRGWLDIKRIEFNAAQNDVPFVIEKKINAKVEVGGDMICIDGRIPSIVMHGPEIKNKAYIGVVTPYDKLPDEIKEANEFVMPFMRKERFRNFWTMEMRDTYLTDPTCRMPSPAGEAQMANYKNLCEIIWEGAAGELVEPETRFKYVVQVMVEHDDNPRGGRVVEIPDSIRDCVFISNACKMDGLYHLVPQPEPCDESFGWVLGMGDTIQEAVDHCKEVAEKLKDQPVTVHLEALVDAVQAVQEEEDAGIDFAKQVPEPADVL
jgi:hypothetical protein